MSINGGSAFLLAVALLGATLCPYVSCRLMQPYIPSSNYVSQPYLIQISVVLTVSMVALLVLLVLLNLLLEDFGPYLKATACRRGKKPSKLVPMSRTSSSLATIGSAAGQRRKRGAAKASALTLKKTVKV